jgi:hypothetical protein
MDSNLVLFDQILISKNEPELHLTLFELITILLNLALDFLAVIIKRIAMLDGLLNLSLCLSLLFFYLAHLPFQVIEIVALTV